MCFSIDWRFRYWMIFCKYWCCSLVCPVVIGCEYPAVLFLRLINFKLKFKNTSCLSTVRIHNVCKPDGYRRWTVKETKIVQKKYCYTQNELEVKNKKTTTTAQIKNRTIYAVHTNTNLHTACHAQWTCLVRKSLTTLGAFVSFSHTLSMERYCGHQMNKTTKKRKKN